MRTTIDGAGRLVIPKETRRGAGLKPGMELDVRLRDGVIEIEPAPAPTRLVRRGHLLVAVAEGEVEPLTLEQVDRLRAEIRSSRAQASSRVQGAKALDTPRRAGARAGTWRSSTDDMLLRASQSMPAGV